VEVAERWQTMAEEEGRELCNTKGVKEAIGIGVC